jgi:hypothetical protein
MQQMVAHYLSTGIALTSLLLSATSVLIARSSLIQAKNRQREWREHKWIDMYFKANEVYDSLERFHVLSESWATEEWEREWNDLMRVIRGAHAMAVVFPQNPAIDAFLSSTAVFKDERTVSDERLSTAFDAVELIREKARLHGAVLQ